MKVVITGSSGMVVEGVLKECIEDSKVSEILILNRKPINIENKKVKEVIINDFFILDEIEQDLKGSDACFFVLGLLQ